MYISKYKNYLLVVDQDNFPLNPRTDYDNAGTMVCWHTRYNLGDEHNYKEPDDFLKSLLFSESCVESKVSQQIYDFLKSGVSKFAKMEYNQSVQEWELFEKYSFGSFEEWNKTSNCSEPLSDWFLNDCICALPSNELTKFLRKIKGMVILPLYLLDHSGLSISTSDFCNKWDSGQVGWIYMTSKDVIREFGEINDYTIVKAKHLLESEVELYDYYLRGEVYGYQLYDLNEEDEIDSCWGFVGEIDEVKDDIKDHLKTSSEEEQQKLIDGLKYENKLQYVSHINYDYYRNMED